MTWASESGKHVVCVSDLLCRLASEKGVMQVTLADHDMEQKVKDPNALIGCPKHVFSNMSSVLVPT